VTAFHTANCDAFRDEVGCVALKAASRLHSWMKGNRRHGFSETIHLVILNRRFGFAGCLVVKLFLPYARKFETRT